MLLETLISPQFLTEMVEGYLACALWTSMDDDGEPLDDDYTLDDLAADTRLRMQADCACFLAEVWEALSHVDLEAGQVGHDFWLTRNGHGAGFWGRCLGVFGDSLTEAAQVHGRYDLYTDELGELVGFDG